MLQIDSSLREHAIDGGQIRNRLLQTMSPEDFEILRDHLEPVKLAKGAVIQDTNKVVTHVYFIESGVVSVVARTNFDSGVELLTFGSDGLVGISAVLDGGPAVYRACVQIAGTAWRINASAIATAMSDRPSIREHLMKFVRMLILRQQHTVLCNAKHDTAQKVARWLLLAQDYVEMDVVPVTHDLLSGLLNARRAGVTQVLAQFETEGIVARSRGTIRIRNRDLLQGKSCNCYKAIVATTTCLNELETQAHQL